MQGVKVRDLKTAKAEKSAIDEEVAKLLLLKKQLAAAKGESTPAAGGKQKGVWGYMFLIIFKFRVLFRVLYI